MKSLKIRLNLNQKQTTLCRKHAGVARHAYNWGVAECQKAFTNKEKIPSAIDLHKRLVAEVKTANPWYYQVSKCAPQQAHTPAKTEKTTGCVGVDLGIKTLATLSNGVVFQSVKPYKKHKRKLKLAQRRVSKKYRKNTKKQSNNYRKAQAKVARIHARIANIRADNLHKLTTHLAKNHSRIVIEDKGLK